jgi:hypothetical protein
MRIKKYRDILVGEDDPLTLKFGVRGQYKCILRDEMGRAVYESDWKDNTILDTGLPTLREGNWALYHHIGDDATAPTTSQTALLGWLASTQTSIGSDQNVQNGASDYSFYTIRGRRFNAGQGTGTIRELGIGDAGGQSNGDMMVRTLVEPAIPKAADQVLDTYYQFIIYPQLTDVTSQVTIDGELYDYTLRPMSIQNHLYAMNAIGFSTGNTMLLYPDPAVLGTIEQGPQGASYVNPNAFGSNTYDDPNAIIGEWNIGLNNGNIVDGIRCVAFPLSYGSTFSRTWIQGIFSRNSDGETIAKDNTQTLQFKARIAWDRYTP